MAKTYIWEDAKVVCTFASVVLACMHVEKHYLSTQETNPEIHWKFSEDLTSFGWDIEVQNSKEQKVCLSVCLSLSLPKTQINEHASRLKTHAFPLNTYIHSSDDMFDVIFVNSLQAILEIYYLSQIRQK